MKLIVITAPWVVAQEAQLINALFDAGMSCLHLRKPNWNVDQFDKLLRDVTPAFYQYIVLHQHHVLVDELKLKGVHYPEYQRLKTPPALISEHRKQGLTVSTSIHNITSLADTSAFDYVFFGPVFNSISKSDYNALPIEAVKDLPKGQGPEIIALGGINLDNLSGALEIGFDGVAVLGHLWMEPEKALERFKRLQTKLRYEFGQTD
ncbi:thiamine phosphate synthase [Pedobacter duraquae]|uniref:Thiamine-phosphate pyrophosphorylase n=1 Tax=Pedobacter duraquae TaxID=425511 RepID=A0A4R6IQ65_9SPHI|nr:thiamine phosphate synthase [Pedobacter duraquae]TDO24462.1 thiamine-phosphate pyrophosphorylase [Pedobacter duraquae]